MALIFERQGNGPQTHALVIGIGGYRHLAGGVDPKPQVIPQIGILRQLTTAPRSAVAFAEVVIEMQDNWVQPLGSVELLHSTAPNDGAFALPNGFESEDATFSNIQRAYERWRERCDEHEDNVAIFYHCGHGVEKEEQFLLTEDFGEFPGNAWRGAFAFDSTNLAMRACKAQTQCFFIDACREITNPMHQHDIRVSALETLDRKDVEGESVFVMKATAGNETALGPKNGVAYCTQALIRALRGDAAEDRGDGWVVRTGVVSDRITDILRLVKADQGFTQRCPCQVTKSIEILRVPVPQVKLEISCDPIAATAVAELSCQSLDDPNEAHVQFGGPLEVEVKAGIYTLAARFPQNEFQATRIAVPATPPVRAQRLDCRP